MKKQIKTALMLCSTLLCTASFAQQQQKATKKAVAAKETVHQTEMGSFKLINHEQEIASDKNLAMTNEPMTTQKTSDGGTASFIIFNKLKTETISNIEQETMNNEVEVSVYPNPFSNNATIEITNLQSTSGNYQFVMFDAMGREVKKFKVQSAKFEIAKDELSHGIYFYKVSDSNSSFIKTGKLIINQ